MPWPLPPRTLLRDLLPLSRPWTWPPARNCTSMKNVDSWWTWFFSDPLPSPLVPLVFHTFSSSSLQVPEVAEVESLPRMLLVTSSLPKLTLNPRLPTIDRWPRDWREMPHTLLSRMIRLLKPTVLMLSAPIWVASYHGRLPTTSSCALAMDPNTLLMDTSSVDLPHFLLHLPTVMLPRMERSFSPHGPKKISEPEERDGGTKLQYNTVRKPVLSICPRRVDSAGRWNASQTKLGSPSIDVQYI